MKKKLHVVFKTHLDIGFTNLSEKIVEQYFEDFIPRAIEIGEAIPEDFTWTTGSWLINAYLTYPDVSKENKERMIRAIQQGTIAWHGLPATTHTELMDQRLFEYGLSISQDLDKNFNKKTIAAKLTDVPGHTIAMVPLMAKAGLKYLHIGVNGSSAIPDVPEMFLWRSKTGEEIIVHYANDYGETFMREGWEEMLYFSHSNDNLGPPKNSQEVTKLLNDLRQQNPEVEVIASTLDAFAECAWSKRETLPVIEEEIGDTWIHGIATDPLKVSNYLELLRLRDSWLDNGELAVASEEYKMFSEQLLLIAEHTWGGDSKIFMPDYKNYLISDFNRAYEKDEISYEYDRSNMEYGDFIALGNVSGDLAHTAHLRSYKMYEKSWQEQRDYLQKAINRLSPERQKQAQFALQSQTPITSLEDSVEEVIPGKTYQFGQMALSFSTTGGINCLTLGKQAYLTDGKEFGSLSYERFDFKSYVDFFSRYTRLTTETAPWCLFDFGKKGIEAFPSIRHELIKPSIEKSSIERLAEQIIVTFDLIFTEFEQKMWGVPRKNQLVFTIDPVNNKINGLLKWNGKQANKMPEAYWLETSLSVDNPQIWQMHKMGEALSPYHVVKNGNRNTHALSQEGLTYDGPDRKVSIKSLDAPLFSFGRRGLLKFDNQQLSLNQGIYVNLLNNVWGTNFPAWYKDDAEYRFEVTLASK